MTTIPDMPDDWYPDGSIIIVAKDHNNELAFAITKEAYLEGHWKSQIDRNLKTLRWCLWQSKKDFSFVEALKEPNSNLIKASELRPQGNV